MEMVKVAASKKEQCAKVKAKPAELSARVPLECKVVMTERGPGRVRKYQPSQRAPGEPLERGAGGFRVPSSQFVAARVASKLKKPLSARTVRRDLAKALGERRTVVRNIKKARQARERRDRVRIERDGGGWRVE